MTSKTGIFSKAINWLLASIVVLLPLAAAPWFENPIGMTKSILFIWTALVVLGLYFLHSFNRKRVQFSISSLNTAVALFGISTLLSIFLTGKYPVEHLLGLGGLYLAFVIIAIIGGSTLPKKSKYLSTALLATGSLVSLSTILQAIGMGPSRVLQAILPLQVPHDLTFSIVGSPFVAAQVILVGIVAVIVSILKSKKITPLNIGALLIMIVGLTINSWISLPGKLAQPIFLPYTVSWSAAVDVLKAPNSALIGVGHENFSSVYNIFKPAWVNGQSWWNIQFNQAANTPFHLLATTGLIGMGTWFLLLWVSFKNFKKSWKSKEAALPATIVCTIFVFQMIYPTNLVLLLIQAVALAYWIAITQTKVARFQALSLTIVDHEQPIKTKTTPAFLSWTSIGLGLVLIGGLFYLHGRTVLAANASFQSVLALQDNNASEVYLQQQRAVQLNPYLPAFRRQYAVTNLNIATALSNKADITEPETQQVAQLIQQSIREARAATVLEPSNVQNWSVLAQVYRQLIGSAEDAPEWTISTYASAIQAAPTDPNLRIGLGGIYLSLEQPAQALALFQQAVDLKQDLANAHYNVANAQKVLGNYEAAKVSYQRTLVLLEADSEAYIQASKELSEVEEMLKKSSTSKTTTETQAELPSILNQNVSQTEEDVVSNPSNQPLELEPTPTSTPEAEPVEEEPAQ